MKIKQYDIFDTQTFGIGSTSKDIIINGYSNYLYLQIVSTAGTYSLTAKGSLSEKDEDGNAIGIISLEDNTIIDEITDSGLYKIEVEGIAILHLTLTTTAATTLNCYGCETGLMI